MTRRSIRRVLWAGSVVLLAVLAATAAIGGTSQATPTGLIFDGDFETGLAPWTSHNGAVQCANYGTPSKSPRLRGNFYFSSNEGELASGQSGQFSLPVDPDPRTWPLEACDLVTGPQPNTLPADDYYGLMVYIPKGWTIANQVRYGVNIDELHFQNVNGAPVTLQLHPDHVTVALETGGCNSYTTPPGCQWRSNADNPTCVSGPTYTCLPGYYAIPPGALVQGKWNEIIMKVHWAPDSSGAFQTWYRVKGSSLWLSGSSMSGHPTVQWDNTQSCCGPSYADILEAYTAALTAPLSVWLDNDVVGTSFAAVAATMPGAGSGAGSGGGGGGSGGRGGRGGHTWPALSALRISPRVFVLSGRLIGGHCLKATRADRRRRRCTRSILLHLRYKLNHRATVRITMQQTRTGRRVGARCSVSTRANRKHRRCLIKLPLPGAVVHSAVRGTNRLTVRGRVAGRPLGPGSYRITATPAANGRLGASRSARLRIVR